MAHRDDNGAGPGANDNASGTAALIELARSYGSPVGARPVSPHHTLVFLSTDGGAFGALGAEQFATNAATGGGWSRRSTSTALARRGPPRFGARGTPSRGSPRRGSSRPRRNGCSSRRAEAPAHPGALGQLIDLAFPFSLYEQAPLSGPRHAGGDADERRASGRRRRSATSRPAQRRAARATRPRGEQLLRWLDAGAELAPGTSTYIYFGPRILRGLGDRARPDRRPLPFSIAVVDLFARCRRRHIPLAPALRSYRSRFGFWLWVAVLFELFALAGFWPDAAARSRCRSPQRRQRDWPVLALIGLVILRGARAGSWRGPARSARRPVCGERGARRGRPGRCSPSACSPCSSWRPTRSRSSSCFPPCTPGSGCRSFRTRPPWARAALLAVGFLGPLLLLGSFALRSASASMHRGTSLSSPPAAT